jgi:hypothetical protein
VDDRRVPAGPLEDARETTFGMSRQICANSTIVGGAAGSWSAVGQKSSISS